MNFMKKRFAIVTLSLALAAGSAMTSFAAGFVGTKDGVKYQWGDGAYCTNNWVQKPLVLFRQRSVDAYRMDPERRYLVLCSRYRRASGRHHENQWKCILL